jgi:hypothetical protein
METTDLSLRNARDESACDNMLAPSPSLLIPIWQVLCPLPQVLLWGEEARRWLKPKEPGSPVMKSFWFFGYLWQYQGLNSGPHAC